jgi:flagellar biosynthetic protein FliR
MDFLTGKIFAYFLILARVGAFMAASPLFSFQAVPNQTKVAMALLLSIILAAVVPCVCPQNPDALTIIVMTGQQIIYGLALGLTAYVIFAVVRIAGSIAEQQMGLTLASILDPFTEDEQQPISLLLEIIFIMLLLASNGHHLLIKALAQSYSHFGVTEFPSVAALTQNLLAGTSAMLTMALGMAAPILAAFLLLMVVLAIMARVAPESDILFLSLPVRVGLGLASVAIFIPFLNDFVSQFAGWLNKLLVL